MLPSWGGSGDIRPGCSPPQVAAGLPARACLRSQVRGWTTKPSCGDAAVQEGVQRSTAMACSRAWPRHMGVVTPCPLLPGLAGSSSAQGPRAECVAKLLSADFLQLIYDK